MTIHTRATSWNHGLMPETLLAAAREWHGSAVRWLALARSGRVGYKHCGLEVEVTEPEKHTPEDVAGAVLAMVAKHHGSTGCALYRIECEDDHGARLGEGFVLRMAEDGADDVTPVNGNATQLAKVLDDLHKRHMQTLDAIPKMVDMVSNCLDAMAGAVAEVCQVRLDQSGEELTLQQEEHKHERSMKFLDMFASYAGASRSANTGRSPLADLLATMPGEVRDTLREILGPLFDDLAAATEKDREERREIVLAVVARISGEQKAALSSRIPEQWQTQIQAALRAEVMPS